MKSDKPSVSPGHLGGVETPSRSSTLLCVDDDLKLLEVLQEYFTNRGFDVLTATNGVEALFQVSRRSPKAVILDLFMPRLGGLDMLDRIRQFDPGIVIIIVSGLPEVLEMVAEARLTVAGVFAKPLELDQISATLIRSGITPLRRLEPAAPGDLAAQAQPGIRKRVLLVDDESDFRAAVVEYLRQRGFEALGAGDGEEALRRIPEFRPHIVLLDIAMPGLNGVETLQRIKALPGGPCVVMVSGIEDLETARRTLLMGAADYVSKPVDFRYLDMVLETHTLMAQLGPESQ